MCIDGCCEFQRYKGSPTKELLNTIKERKMQYLGHVMRGDRYEILRLIIEGKVQEKRSVGRPQNSKIVRPVDR